MQKFPDIILDSVYDLIPDRIPCPCCGCAADWNYRSVQTQRFVWETSMHLIYVDLPILSFRCIACGSKGNEMVTTDLTIGKSELSFHYLFKLIQLKNSPETELVRKETLLYERMCQDSFFNWHRRFFRDFNEIHNKYESISVDMILREDIIFGKMFRIFYQITGRFFLHSNDTKIIVV
mgnify:FL=1